MSGAGGARRGADLFIVCGGGQTGQTAIEELRQTGRNFVVLEKSPEVCSGLRQRLPPETVFEGDATDGEVLRTVGVERARALLATLAEDKLNLVLTVTALQANPRLQVFSRVTDPDQEERLRRAGARVVSPPAIASRRLAAGLLHPVTTMFLSEMLTAPSERPVRFEALVVTGDSEANGKSLGELDLLRRTGLQVIAVGKSDGSFQFNPGFQTRLQQDDRLIVIGDWQAVDMMAPIVGRWE